MFDPLAFFALAKQLATGNEARVRTAVGRAYYASFLLTRDRLGVRGMGPEVHRLTIKRLHSMGHYKMAQRLGWLRTLRNLSDYNTFATVSRIQGERALSLADFVIRRLGEIGGEGKQSWTS